MKICMRKIEHYELTLTPMEEAVVRKAAAEMCKNNKDDMDNVADYYDFAAYSVLPVKDLLDSAAAQPLLKTETIWQLKEEN